MMGAEFSHSIDRFQVQWPRALSQVRADLLWQAWRALPDGVFSAALDALIYRGGFAPSGDTIDEMVKQKLTESRDKGKVHAPPPKENLSQEVAKHPEFMKPDEEKFGGALCGMFRCIQRAILVKDTRGVSGALRSLGITKAEAFEIYKDMRGGTLSQRVEVIKNRNVLQTLMKEPEPSPQIETEAQHG